MFTILLVFHLFCVMGWFGGAIYERFFTVRRLYKTRGTQLEVEYAKLILATEKMFMVFTLGVLLSGILMTVTAGYGFFDLSWLGVKQMVMVGMLLLFVTFIAPRMKRFKAAMKPVMKNGELLTDECRKNISQFVLGLDFIHIGIMINAVLALWKPF